MIGLGCMRLSTADDRDQERGIAVIQAALDAGATLLDTADAYCRDESEIGHNERLIATALAGWSGDRSRITVASKGGMRRPKRAWVPDGRAKHLREACEASLRALGVEAIDLYQLHVVDPKVSIETSVRALAKLKDEGKIRNVGLCNVTVQEIRAAQEIVAIASVQVSLSPFDDENLRNGVAEYCRDNGIPLIAHRPLGGERVKKLARDEVLARVAAKHSVTVQEAALAWLMGLDVAPIPGATRVETAMSLARTLSIELDDDDRAALDARFSGRLLRVPRAERRPPKHATGDVVIVMGMPGAGKSSLARSLESDGYHRLNRDALGGSLSDLVPLLDEALRAGDQRVILDNTYPTRGSRNEVIETAWERGVPVRCIWLTTAVPDAQINSIHRMLEAHGSLPTPEEIRRLGKSDSRYLLPDAQFRYERTLEPPSIDEGFESVEERAFAREAQPGGRPGLILDFDDVSGRDMSRVDILRSEGWLVLAHAWRPGGDQANPPAIDHVDHVGICVHEAGPPVCWCRKPIPGSALEFARRFGVSLAQSLVVGTAAADRTMAERIGARFETSESFFG